MRWRGNRQSENVEDLRGNRGRNVALGGGLGAIVVTLLIIFLGGDPEKAVQTFQAPSASESQQVQPLTAEEKEAGEFVSVILASTEDVWKELFQQMNREYREPKLVLFSGSVESACGFAQSATGPFYCPGDEKVYIDLEIFKELQERLNATGDFAQAYVIAHEIGHHVQTLLGTMAEVDDQRSSLSKKELNRLTVRLELQADFLAGVWAHHAQRTKDILEQGDIEEGLNAAAAVGDDRLQKMQTGQVVPDAFTHGTSEQRVRWFTQGFKTGDLRQGDTFHTREL